MNEARVFWVEASIPGRIAVVARPRSMLHFVELKRLGVDVLVSMLEPDEAKEVGLDREAEHCARAGIEYLSVPITDHGVPGSFESIDAAVADITIHLARGRGVGAHCYAGLGRSPLMVASILIHHGLSHRKAIDLVSAARGLPVPEMDSQHVWLFNYALRGSR